MKFTRSLFSLLFLIVILGSMIESFATKKALNRNRRNKWGIPSFLKNKLEKAKKAVGGLANKAASGIKSGFKTVVNTPVSIAGLAKKTGGMFGGLLNKTKAAGRALGGRIGGAAKKTGGMFGGLLNKAKGGLKKTGGMFGGLLNKAKGGLKGLGGRIGGAAKKTGGMFGGLLNKAKGGLKKTGGMFGGLLNKAKGGLKGFGGKIGGAAKKTGGMFGRFLNKAKGGITGAAKKTGGMFGRFLNKAKGGITGAAKKTGGMFGGLLNKAKGFGRKIGGAAGGLFGMAKRGLGGFKNSLSNMLNKAKGGKTPKMAPLSAAAQAANAKGKAFCAANCRINPAAQEKKCLDGGKLVPCKRCTGNMMADASKKSVCELVCNGNLPMSPCDFYGYVNNKKKGVNLTLLSKFGLTIVRRKYRQ